MLITRGPRVSRHLPEAAELKIDKVEKYMVLAKMGEKLKLVN